MKPKQKAEIVCYDISKDGKGLLAYWEDDNFYHIHSNEMTKLEKWILEVLKKGNSPEAGYGMKS